MRKEKINPDNSAPGENPEQGILRHKNIWRSIAYLITLAIIILSLIPDPEDITPFSASDKLMHVIAYAVSMLWFGLCFKREKLFYIGAGLIFLGIALEVVQGQTGYRDMSLLDIAANCLGVFTGLLLSYTPVSRLLLFIEQRLLS